MLHRLCARAARSVSKLSAISNKNFSKLGTGSSRSGGKAFAGFAAVGLGCSALALGYLQQDIFADNEAASVFTWGSDQYGQLGDGGEIDVHVPEVVPDLEDKDVIQIDACGHSTAALTANGDVYTFGCGMHSRLGHGHSFQQENEILPRKLDQLGPCLKVALGEYHGAAITADGKLYTWGRDLSGMLGHKNPQKGYPNLVAGNLESEEVVGASCGLKHTAAVTSSGKLFTWGLGREGALGHGNRESLSEPKQVAALDGIPIVAVSCGRDSTLALTDDGEVFVWGSNDFGQLGMGKSGRYQRTPVKLRRIPEKVVQVAAGELHAVVLTTNGKVYTWGKGSEGQTGLNSVSDTAIPKIVEDLKDKRVVKVAAGGGHTACVTDEGEVFMFGRGRNGQLGQGDKLASVAAHRTSPVKVNFFGDDTQMFQIACGKDHTVALATAKSE